MTRFLVLSAVLVVSTVLYSPGVANALAYCAQYRSAGVERDCGFSTLKECRASVKAKGGGHCYKK